MTDRELLGALGALARVLSLCQEVAHEVEDPIQACAEIEEIVRAALDQEADK